MSQFRIIIQPPAAIDMEQAFRWIADRNPEGAAKWFLGLQETIQGLSRFPEQCPLAPENDAFKEEIRQLVHGRRAGRYRVIFTIRTDTIYILHVRHGARDYMEPGHEE